MNARANLVTKDVPGLAWVQRLIGVGLAYYGAARLGLLIPYVGSHVSLVWLPTGIAVAAYFRWGPRVAPAILAAAFAVNQEVGGPLRLAIGIAVGNALGPWIATRLLVRWGFDASLTRRRDLGIYMAAVALGMLVTASNGTFWLEQTGVLPAQMLEAAWATWWIGDAVGALLGGIPLLALSFENLREAFAHRRGAVNVGIVLLVLACGVLGFSPWTSPQPALLFPLLSLPLFLIAVLALRSGVLPASIAVLLLSMSAAWGTANGVGPFAHQTPHAGLLALWSYLTAQASTTVLICGLAAELLASRRQQAAVFTEAEDGILVVGPNGILEDLNPAALKFLGASASTCLQQPLQALPNTNGLALQALLAQGRRPGDRSTTSDVALQGNAAEPLQVEAQLIRYTDARGRQMTQILLRDVTARRNAEARLATSEERLRAIADHAPALMAEFDTDMRFQFANEAYHQWLNVKPEEMVQQSVREVFGDRIFNEVRPYLEGVLTGQPQNYDRLASTMQGDRWFNVSLVPKYQASGDVAGFYSVGSDVTSHRQAMQALRQSEQHLRTIADHLPMRVSYVDKEGRYRFVNLAYERSFGRPRDSIYGLTVREVLGEGAFGQAQPWMQRVLGGETVSYDSEMTTREGYRHFKATYVPQFGDDGAEVLGYIAIVVDTTAQKQELQRLIELAQVDTLTGLLNRAGFDQRLAEAMERHRSTRGLMALLFLDLDGFKQVNDRLGHLAGDTLLSGFAGRLMRAVRNRDMLARTGGDEFVVIAENLSDNSDASTIAANIIAAMKEPFILEQCPVNITTSIGVALYRGEAGIAPRDLVKLADELLYTAKAEGRNRFVCQSSGHGKAD